LKAGKIVGIFTLFSSGGKSSCCSRLPNSRKMSSYYLDLEMQAREEENIHVST
jgi:hypothetical protein